jgi:hypothetical protein
MEAGFGTGRALVTCLDEPGLAQGQDLRRPGLALQSLAADISNARSGLKITTVPH